MHSAICETRKKHEYEIHGTTKTFCNTCYGHENASNIKGFWVGNNLNIILLYVQTLSILIKYRTLANITGIANIHSLGHFDRKFKVDKYIIIITCERTQITLKKKKKRRIRTIFYLMKIRKKYVLRNRLYPDYVLKIAFHIFITVMASRGFWVWPFFNKLIFKPITVFFVFLIIRSSFVVWLARISHKILFSFFTVYETLLRLD